MSINNIIQTAKEEMGLIFHTLPESVKRYEKEALYVCNQVKKGLASPEAALIEAAIADLLPGTWEATVITDIAKAIGIAIPILMNGEANGNGTVAQWTEALIRYLQALSPRMQHAGLLKLLSGIFIALDPSIKEVDSDYAAQVVYKRSKI